MTRSSVGRKGGLRMETAKKGLRWPNGSVHSLGPYVSSEPNGMPKALTVRVLGKTDLLGQGVKYS
jgi:hypothetical protein